MKRNKSQAGFTLVELMIVIAVIAILATMGLLGFRAAQKSARDTQRLSNLRGVQAALECRFSVDGSYPSAATWNDMTGWLGDCWSADATALAGKPAGDGVDAAGEVTRGGGAVSTYTYIQGANADSYTLELYGESRTLTLESPK